MSELSSYTYPFRQSPALGAGLSSTLRSLPGRPHADPSAWFRRASGGGAGVPVRRDPLPARPATDTAADVLSDVLRAVRQTGSVYFDFDLSSPWVAEAPPSREIAGTVMPGAQRVIEYHLIASGTCW